MSEEIHYKVIKLIEADPEISQRELSRQLGVSLGKVNYCLHALIDKGWIKARNFKNSQNKLAYRYFLTPHGIQEKSAVAARFLKRKVAEYEKLQLEIAHLRCEVEEQGKGKIEDNRTLTCVQSLIIAEDINADKI